MDIETMFIKHKDNLDLFLDKSVAISRKNPQQFLMFLNNFFINFHFTHNEVSLPLFKKIVENPYYKNFFLSPSRQEILIYFILNNFIDLKYLKDIPSINLTNNVDIIQSIKKNGKGKFTQCLAYFIEEKLIDPNLLFNNSFIDDFNIFKFFIEKIDNNCINNKFIKDFLLTSQLKHLEGPDIKVITPLLIKKEIFFSLADIVTYYYEKTKFNDNIFDCLCVLVEQKDINSLLDFIEQKPFFKPSDNILTILNNRYERLILEDNIQKSCYEQFIKKKKLEKEFLIFLQNSSIHKI